MRMRREDLLELLRLVDITRPAEIDCGEFLSRVSGYLERLRGGEQPGPEHAGVVQHLRTCPECLEEFEALYEVMRAESQ